jgi:3-methyladenine DNA glycosylase AlkD
MKYREVMATLREMGTAQNVKIYRRHGAGDKLFGVSFANLNKLKKQIGMDHKLAEQLWRTGNTDARTLALMIADPNTLTASEADAWLKDIQYSLLADMLAGLVARSDLATKKLKKWTRSRQETTRVCGYSLLASILKDVPELLSDDVCGQYIDTIERQIHGSANLARHAMNTGLIAIGIYRPNLRDDAIAAARRMGKVEVDHGQTSCKTPDAESYINKAAARHSKRG